MITSPVSLSTYGSIEGDDNFTEHYTYNLQVMLARSITRYVNVFFSPGVHFNANGQRRFDPRSTDFFPPAATVDLHQAKHSGSFGFGVNGRIRPTVSLLFEYTPRVGFKLGRIMQSLTPQAESSTFDLNQKPRLVLAFRRTLVVTPSRSPSQIRRTTATSRYNSSNLELGKVIGNSSWTITEFFCCRVRATAAIHQRNSRIANGGAVCRYVERKRWQSADATSTRSVSQ